MKRRPGWYLALTIFAATSSVGHADSGWNRANEAYSGGKFEQAKVEYIQLAGRREFSPELFYNLGNAWFRLDDQGRAILNYNRALVLNPAFEEAKANLETALKIVGNDDPKTIREELGTFADYFVLAASCSFWVTAFCLGWLLQKRASLATPLGFMSMFAAVIFLAILAISFWVGPGMKDPNRALVVEAATDLKYGPANTAHPVESLQIGQPVELISARGDWTFCRANTGALGWILSRKIERVIPQ
jgi:tetratricopeptide (TPR) repeat protein